MRENRKITIIDRAENVLKLRRREREREREGERRREREREREREGESYWQHELHMFISNGLNIGFVDMLEVLYYVCFSSIFLNYMDIECCNMV